MCGRFTLTRPDLDTLARELGAEVDAEAARLHRPRWNVAPATRSVILLQDGERRLVSARFGTDAPGGRFVINARSETAARLRSFRNAFAHARCVVLADGFYEWPGDRGDRRPVWFHPPGGGLLLLAGLAFDGAGFVVLTTGANELIHPLHDRMPVLLSHDGAERWLTRPDDALLVPASTGALVAREVSERVNDVANDGPDLLDAPRPRRQLTLL
jgi:putative SOS response-associated peptidase YedK